MPKRMGPRRDDIMTRESRVPLLPPKNGATAAPEANGVGRHAEAGAKGADLREDSA